jgi:hypothetical protein
MERISITEQDNARLRDILLKIIEALDDGRLGDIRRLATKGTDKPVITLTSVIARNGK